MWQEAGPKSPAGSDHGEGRRTFNHRTGDCIKDLHNLPGNEYAYSLPRPMMDVFCCFFLRAYQTRKAFARMGVVSSTSSDLSEIDQAPASRANHKENSERDDKSYRRVFLDEAEQALGSDMVHKYHSTGNQFERFRGFLELISRFEFEFRRRGNYIF